MEVEVRVPAESMSECQRWLQGNESNDKGLAVLVCDSANSLGNSSTNSDFTFLRKCVLVLVRWVESRDVTVYFSSQISRRTALKKVYLFYLFLGHSYSHATPNTVKSFFIFCGTKLALDIDDCKGVAYFALLRRLVFYSVRSSFRRSSFRISDPSFLLRLHRRTSTCNTIQHFIRNCVVGGRCYQLFLSFIISEKMRMCLFNIGWQAAAR